MFAARAISSQFRKSVPDCSSHRAIMIWLTCFALKTIQWSLCHAKTLKASLEISAESGAPIKAKLCLYGCNSFQVVQWVIIVLAVWKFLADQLFVNGRSTRHVSGLYLIFAVVLGCRSLHYRKRVAKDGYEWLKTLPLHTYVIFGSRSGFRGVNYTWRLVPRWTGF